MKETLSMIKKQGPFLWVLGVGLLVFFGPIFFAGKGFYYGDYKQQFYPWAWYLYKCVRHFSLPLWAPEIGCGFPLLAEGQIGALHPLQTLLFVLLPFVTAYSLAFVFYFMLSGLFVYLLSRQLQVSAEGATIAAVVFLFSSAYAGMAFGLASLRTLSTFPMCLVALGKIFETPKSFKPVAWLALSLGVTFLGGYFPMMPYVLLGCVLYFFYGLQAAEAGLRWRLGVKFLLALFLATGLAAAQLLPTVELAGFSSRVTASLDFALQKSLNPLSFVTLLWPGFGAFLGFDFYTGILPLCLAVFALTGWRQDRRVIFFAVWSIIFAALALGRYNPLYVAALKIFPLYFLRMPYRALIFVSFSLAILAGMGYDRWSLAKEPGVFKKLAAKVFLWALLPFFTASLAARFFGPQILRWGEGYVRSHVVGKYGHAYSLETYLARLPDALTEIHDRTSLFHPYILMTLGVWIVCLVFVFSVKFFHTRKTILFFGAIALILADLFFYTNLGSGFKGNAVRLETIAADSIISKISSDPGSFRVYDYVSDPVSGAPHWLPNTNLLFGYSSVGLYSPLATNEYREYLKPLGSVDNATGFYPASRESLEQNKKMLDWLNVRYVVSKDSLDGVSGLFPVLVSENGDHLYENPTFLKRALVVTSEGSLLPGEATILEHSPGSVHVRTKTDQDAFLFLSDLHYSGWKAFLDGKPALIHRMNGVFRGVKLTPGDHQVRFAYVPFSFYAGVAISVLSLLGCGLCFVLKK